MTESIYPRWVVTYRAPSPGSQPQTLTIAAPDMVAAIKAAQMKLAALRVADDKKTAYKITLIEPAPDAPDVPHPVGDVVDMVSAASDLVAASVDS